MSEKKKNIALTWGSTGWHVFPLLSLYNYFSPENKYNFFWVWEADSLEETISDENDIEFYDIPCWKIRRYFDWKNFYEPLKNLSGIFFGIYFIITKKIDIVFSKGWYVSLPLCIAAFILRKPVYIHESDCVWGVANKLISKIATKTFYSFENKKTQKDESKISLERKHIFSGQILNPDLLDYITTLEVKENEKLEILVIAGSQGSTRLFENVLQALPDMWDINFTVILWEKNIHFKTDFQRFFNVTVHEFVDQKTLGKLYKKSDIAISRAGATTLWELYNFGVHTIIVPLSESAGDHQNKNAEYFHDKFSSDVLDENNNLSLEIFRLLQKYKALRKSGVNLNDFFKSLKTIENYFDK